MKKYSQWPILLVAVVFAGGWLSLHLQAVATQKKPDAPLKKFMRKKLKASDEILEGLVTEDFDLVSNGARKLQMMSADEQWRVSNDALYRQYSAEFQRVTKRLETMAKERELEGATLAWLESTMSCIKCHKHVRAILIADHSNSRLDELEPTQRETVNFFADHTQRPTIGDGGR